jgi:hypothetical protein
MSECGAQRAMSGDDLLQASNKGRDLKRTAQPNCRVHIVKRIARDQLSKEPQPPLRE